MISDECHEADVLNSRNWSKIFSTYYSFAETKVFRACSAIKMSCLLWKHSFMEIFRSATFLSVDLGFLEGIDLMDMYVHSCVFHVVV